MYDSGRGSTIGGDNLDPQHARMMLLLSLAFTNDLPYSEKVNKVREWFITFGTQDVEISVDANTVLEVNVETENEELQEIEIPLEEVKEDPTQEEVTETKPTETEPTEPTETELIETE